MMTTAPSRTLAESKFYHTMKAILMILTAITLSSCGVSVKYESQPNTPFEATAYSLAGIAAAKPQTDPPDPFDFSYSPFFKPFYLLDLPISLVADTLTFPVDLFKWLSDRSESLGETSEDKKPRKRTPRSEFL